MNLTSIAWLMLFVFLTLKTLQRPVWGIPLYLQTVFALPATWWWGKGLLESVSNRWSLIASLVFLFGVILDREKGRLDGLSKLGIFMYLAYLLNALGVHFLLANNRDISWENLVLMSKQFLLFFMFLRAIHNRKDFEIALWSIFIGAGFIGYQVVINGAGRIIRGRLELPAIPDANDSNLMAACLLLAFPIGGCMLLFSRGLKSKLTVLVLMPLILDTVLRCNSRGAFLGLIVMGVWILVFSPNAVRKKTLLLLILGVLAVLVQAKNEKIWERFGTTFAGSEELDGSARGRLDYWGAAVELLSHHPFGLGGEAAFKSDVGVQYIRQFGDVGYRAVHSGYLDIACGWGVQGLFILLMIGLTGFWQLWRLRGLAKTSNDGQALMLSISLQSMLASQAVSLTFISALDNEWVTWLLALSFASGSVIGDCEEELSQEDEEIFLDEIDDEIVNSDSDLSTQSVSL